MRKSLIFIVLVLCVSAVFIPSTSAFITGDLHGSINDGYLAKTDADYTTAHDANIAGMIDVSNPLRVGQVAGWTIYRSYLYFNTASIPDAAKIYDARLHFFVSSGNPMTIRAIPDPSDIHPQNPLVVNDYDMSNYGGTLFGLSQLISSVDWQELIINDSDQPNYMNIPISKTGTTKFCLISEVDYEGHPTAVGTLIFDSYDQANKPHLVITYNTPPNTPSTPSGSATAKKGYTYAINVSATDPDVGDQLQYEVHWGDGSTSTTSWCASGITAHATHKYSSNGLKTITVKAIDDSGLGYLNERTSSSSPGFVVNVSTKYIPDTGGQLPPGEDPNQKIEKVSATFVQMRNWEDLKIWWTLNGAASAQNDLNIKLTLENYNGSKVLFEGSARDHNTEEKALSVTGFTLLNRDWNRWNFKLKAEMVNPTEPSTSDKGDNTAELYMVLGMWVYVDFMFWAVIIGVIALIIFMIYRARKILFMKWYDRYKVDEKTKLPYLDEEGDMPGIFERMADSRNYWKWRALNTPKVILRPNPNVGKDLYRTVRNVSSFVPGATFAYGGIKKRTGKVQKWWKDMPPDVGNKMLTRMTTMNKEEARKVALKTRERLVGALGDYEKSGKKMPREMYKDLKRAITTIDRKYYPKGVGFKWIKTKTGGYWKPYTSASERILGPVHWASKRIEYKHKPINVYPLIAGAESSAFTQERGWTKGKEKGKGRPKKEKEEHTHLWSSTWHWTKRGENLYDIEGTFIGIATGKRYVINEDGTQSLNIMEAVPKRDDKGLIDRSELRGIRPHTQEQMEKQRRDVKNALKKPTAKQRQFAMRKALKKKYVPAGGVKRAWTMAQ